MQILFQRFSRLGMGRFMSNIRIFFVTRTFIVFGAVCFPIAQTHPTEIVTTAETLHVIATAILFDAYVAFGTVFRMRTDIVGSFTVVSTFCQPFFDDLTIGGCMIVGATFEAK